MQKPNFYVSSLTHIHFYLRINKTILLLLFDKELNPVDLKFSILLMFSSKYRGDAFH